MLEKLHLNKDIEVNANKFDEGDVCCVFCCWDNSNYKTDDFIVVDAIRIEKLTNTKITFTYLTNSSGYEGKTVSKKLTTIELRFKPNGLVSFEEKLKAYAFLDADKSVEIFKKIKKIALYNKGIEGYSLNWLQDIVYSDCEVDNGDDYIVSAVNKKPKLTHYDFRKISMKALTEIYNYIK